jgi:O-antigen/teichoic acid export membrane protein
MLGNLAAIRRQFLHGLALITMVIAPLSVGIALCADLACQLLLGPKWIAAVELIRLCALYALFDYIGHFTHNLFVVLNRQKRLVVTYAPSVLLRFGAAIWAGVTWGMAAAVWVLMITAVLNAIIWTVTLLPVLQLRMMEVVNALWRTFASCLVMSAVLVAFAPLTSAGATTPILAARLMLAAALGGTVYLGMQVLLWLMIGTTDGPEMRAWDYLRGQVRRLVALRAARRHLEAP